MEQGIVVTQYNHMKEWSQINIECCKQVMFLKIFLLHNNQVNFNKINLSSMPVKNLHFI